MISVAQCPSRCARRTGPVAQGPSHRVRRTGPALRVALMPDAAGWRIGMRIRPVPINTSRSSARGTMPHMAIRTTLGCSQGPSGSAWPDPSPNRHPRWPSWNRGAPAGSHMRPSLDWPRRDSSHSPGSRARPGTGTGPAPSRKCRASHRRPPRVSRRAAPTSQQNRTEPPANVRPLAAGHAPVRRRVPRPSSRPLSVPSLP